MNYIEGPYYTGTVRWHAASRCLEVMDQSGGWQALWFKEQHHLPPDAYELLNWAREERQRQQNMRALREQYPTLDQALTHAEVITALVTERG
jgi:predicted DsbA family dithiol-disulfide isomerase